VLLIGKDYLHLELERLRTLTLVNLVFSGQAIYYVVRERRCIWSSKPSAIVLASSAADLAIVPSLAFGGILMVPLPLKIIMSVFAAAVVFAFLLDQAKVSIFRLLRMT